MGQLLLLADPRPLEARLGRKFFRTAPKRPGVYVMRDAAGKVLYVGKARNLQRRLRNYRIANPDRMPRRHLRMLREVARIELQFCPGEAAALKHEAKLLRSLKPKFNRAGVWPGKISFLVWRFEQRTLELGVTEVPEPNWRRFGPLGGGGRDLLPALARLLWLALNPARNCTELPAGWARGTGPPRVSIDCNQRAPVVATGLSAFFWQSPDEFISWLGSTLTRRTHSFERAVIESDLQILKNFSARQTQAPGIKGQIALL